MRGATAEDITWLATEADRSVLDGFLEVEIVPWAVIDSIFDFGDEDEDDEDRSDEEE